jgi:hypothetical protein
MKVSNLRKESGVALTGVAKIDVFSVMRNIVNQLWELGDVTIEKLMKYNRFLLQMTLPRSSKNAFSLLEETCQMAQEITQVSSSSASIYVRQADDNLGRPLTASRGN